MTVAHELLIAELKAGKTVRVRVASSSMVPAIAPGDELLVSFSTPGQLEKGDIILLCCGVDWIAHRFIEHRIIHGRDHLVAAGDLTGIPDAPVPASDLVGRVVAAERDGRPLSLSPDLKLTRVMPSRAVLDRLLFSATCIDAAAPGPADALAREIECGPGWAWFVRRASAEGLAELAWLGLRAGTGLGWPLAALELEHATTLARNTLFLSQLTVVTQALDGMDLIALKGAYLASKIYDNPGLRRFGDIDILIHREDMSRAMHCLALAGYQVPTDVMDRGFATDGGWLNSVSCRPIAPGPALHVHWHIFNSVLPKYGNANMDVSELWTCARLFRPGVLELDPAHTLLHLAEHALRHSFDRLILLRDQVELIRKQGDRIDWARFVADARRFGLDRPVFFNLRLLQALAGDLVPADVVARLTPKRMGLFEHVFLRMTLAGVRRSELCNLAYLGGMPTTFGRMRYVFGLLFPPRPVLALAYGKTPSDIRVSDYICRIGRGLRQVLRVKSRYWEIK